MFGGKIFRRAGSTLGVALLGGLICSGVAQAETSTFIFTGTEQTFTVPAGVTVLHVEAFGAPGGTGTGGPAPASCVTPTQTTPCLGGAVAADLPVTPGQLLYIEIGGAGGNGSANSGGDGGFNGGGNGGDGSIIGGGGGGGGASDVRAVSVTAGSGVSLASRLVTAAGGGGSGGTNNGGGAGGGGYEGGPGGNGGVGLSGNGGTGGSGGTQIGPGGSGAQLGQPGFGGLGDSAGVGAGGGGGGGAGLYGGGGGLKGIGTGSGGGGGGGGSSGVAPQVTNFIAGPDSGDTPAIVLNYTAGSPTAGSTAPTGQRAAALAKCKKKKSKAKRRKCQKRARQLPV